MYRLLRLYVNRTHVKHICWSSTSTDLYSKGKKSINPKSIQRQSNQYSSWENAKGESAQTTQNCLNSFFPILIFSLNISSAWHQPQLSLLSHSKAPVCTLPLAQLSIVQSHWASLVSSDFPVFSSQQREAQELTSRLL